MTADWTSILGSPARPRWPTPARPTANQAPRTVLLIPNYDVYATLVYGASAKDVRTTIINGRVIMEDRKVLTVDAADIKAHMRAMAAKISAQVGPVPK